MEVASLILQIVLIVASVCLIVVVLLQSGQSSGLGAAFGGETQTFTGAKGRAASKERKLQKITVILGIVIGVLALVILILE